MSSGETRAGLMGIEHSRCRHLIAPDLGTGSSPVTVSVWRVAEGQTVVEGDRVVELVCGAATIDLEAPVSGRLKRQLVDEDEPVTPGMPLAEFEAEP